jgi:cytochrome P450
MMMIADLELPYLALEEASFAADPFTPFETARRQHPWLAKCSFGYVLTQYSAMRDLLSFDDKMAVGYSSAVDMIGAAGTPWGEFIKHAIQNQTGTAHKRLRDVVAPAFTPREANRHREVMREEILRLLGEWGPRGAFDFELFISYYPISVMCRIVGASPDVVPGLRSSLEILGLGGNLDPNYVPRFNECFKHIDGFVRQLAADRRAGHRPSAEPDLLDRLLQINDSGGLTEDEVFNLLVFVFVGGYDTSKNMLTIIMNLLLGREADYGRCAADLEFCRRVMDEAFRYSGVASSPRVPLEDIVFRDVQIPKGTMLFVPWSVSGRDPEGWERPDVFDPERPKGCPIMPFGRGPHMCLGQFIARAQIEEGLHLIAQRLGRPRRTGVGGFRVFPGVWGHSGLPIEFEYRPA